ncbi:DUF4359 domain-containing protein [Cyanobacterium aponinum]|uniref:DUF4359 domain-containing protein n=1 Tax=Cyanobacterium aponinum (strain PCC 10605) TaxID=755178 RepID=K9Z3Q0_CYAAP|nr:DUF4359 domain-containing protein [Cyanobacterium aponinum]AFZ53185.1 hypothetical protein Cyan10605_1061 [Cyanobacterium aponinum PCC 10605]
MKLSRISLLILGAFFLYGYFTNPSEQKFNEFITENTQGSLKDQICNANKSEDILSNLKSLTCNFVADQSSGAIEQFLSENTIRNNYLIFSIYQVKTPVYKSQTLGIFNQFFLLYQSSPIDSKN